MPQLIQHLIEEPEACSYIPTELASLEHRIMLDVEPPELDALLERGWRRFGPDYFRPVCASCSACVPTRIVADAFTPSRSQRRAMRNMARLRVTVGRPIITDDRLALYRAWHSEREDARAWAPSELDERGYALQFAFPHPSAREVAYYDEAEDKLVGVGICDETPNAWSAVYFFYDPAYARLSPGTGHIVTLVAIARARMRRYVYLGYRVAACPSLRYKAAFLPHEVLVGWPAKDEAPRWVRVD